MHTCGNCGHESLTGVRGYKGIPFSWIFPEYIQCSQCGERVRKTGWFSDTE
jgi:DNA-directed RNA polymerase subunit RPC12/RpoP